MRTLILAALVLGLSFSAYAAEPGESPLGALAEPLARKLDVQFIETPLRRVIEQMQQRTGVTMMLEVRELGEMMEAPVSLEAKQITAEQVLNIVTRQAGADWEVAHGVLVVSSWHAIAQRNLVTRVYDIRPLLVAIPHFRGPTFDLNASLSNTNSGGSNARMSDASVSSERGSSIFGDADDVESGFPAREEVIAQIISLIRDNVGQPESWDALGGDLYTAREVRGSLVVRLTPKLHEEAAKVLVLLASDTSRVIHIDARFAEVSTEVLDRVLSQANPQHVLDAKSAADLMKQIGGEGTRSLGVLRTACFNGQRVYLAAGKQDTYLSDAEPIPDTAGIDPTVSTARTGAVLDIEPTVGFDGDSLVMTFRGELVLRTSLRTTSIPAGSPATGPSVELGGGVDGRVKMDEPAKDKDVTEGRMSGRVDVAGDVAPGSRGIAAEVALELPHGEAVEFRSSVRVPDGGAVVVTGASGAMGSVRPGHEVVLVIRPVIAK